MIVKDPADLLRESMDELTKSQPEDEQPDHDINVDDLAHLDPTADIPHPASNGNGHHPPEPAATPPAADRRNLPDDFWNARPELTHIRQAAHSRIVSADAVLVTVLARIACLIPPTVRLPPIVGGVGSLNMFGAMVAASGGGKTAAKSVASELVPLWQRHDIRDNVSPGSGEGLIESYLEWVMEPDDDGKQRRVKQQTKQAVFVFADEGQGLIAMGDRSGATIMPILRTAWSGGDLGTANATQETQRHVKAHQYRLGLVVGFQLAYAATLIADGEGGTPQRFVFANAIDPHIPDTPPAWPGELHIVPPAGVHDGIEIGVSDGVRRDIIADRLARSRGEHVDDPLDTHTNLGRLKLAALLAALDDRPLGIDLEDWHLAGVIMDTSRSVRAWAIEYARQVDAEQARGRIFAAVEREAAIATDAERRSLESGARSIARKLHKLERELPYRELQQAVAGKHRQAVSVHDMIAAAERYEWIVRSPGGWKAGRSRPV